MPDEPPDDVDLDAQDLLFLDSLDADAPEIADLAIALRDEVWQAIDDAGDVGLTFEEALAVTAADSAELSDRSAATRRAAARLLAIETMITEGEVRLLLDQAERGGAFRAVLVTDPTDLDEDDDDERDDVEPPTPDDPSSKTENPSLVLSR